MKRENLGKIWKEILEKKQSLIVRICWRKEGELVRYNLQNFSLTVFSRLLVENFDWFHFNSTILITFSMRITSLIISWFVRRQNCFRRSKETLVDGESNWCCWRRSTQVNSTFFLDFHFHFPKLQTFFCHFFNFFLCFFWTFN